MENNNKQFNEKAFGGEILLALLYSMTRPYKGRWSKLIEQVQTYKKEECKIKIPT